MDNTNSSMNFSFNGIDDLNFDFVSPNDVIDKNIHALRIKSPVAADQISRARAHQGIEFIETDDRVLGATLDGRALGSKRRPMREAQRFVDEFDAQKNALSVINGFGLGYHCSLMLAHLGAMGAVICYEPDLGLLRSVLERIDCSELFESKRFFLITDEHDSTVLSQMFNGMEAIIGLGVELMDHPPSVVRLGDRGEQFGKMFSEVLSATRTSVVTTLANAQLSFRNGLMNLGQYIGSPGIESLRDSCLGKPAILIAAGPSLERNLDLLKDPKVRSSFVVIAVQTVLKTLLARGIKPNFVTALDYHEVSKRFYEGLSASDVEGIRLVVEPKANAAILDSFPGEVLCVQDETLDLVIGEVLKSELGSVEAGGTVAHLCYTLARFLGCDPVIMIGQDLGFTDGHYYAPGAAIHKVWSGELNPHRTLEMMEWERIARMKSFLVAKRDIEDRLIYTDLQMSTYLSHFESMFQRDVARSMSVIDASEGGVGKLHTKTMTLAQAIVIYGDGEVCVPPSPRASDVDSKLIQRRFDSLIEDCERIVYLSDRSIELFKQMIKVQKDQKKLNKMIVEIQSINQQVLSMRDAFKLSEVVNQIGVLNRMRYDREISFVDEGDPFEKQRKQIERDQVNVQWTRDAAQSVGSLLRTTLDVLLGKEEKEYGGLDELQRDHNQVGLVSEHDVHEDSPSERDVVHAIVIADPEMNGLGIERDLSVPIYRSMNALEITIRRIDQSQSLDGITVMSPDPERAHEMLGSIKTRLPIRVVGVDLEQFRDRARKVGLARMQSSECWRGSIGMLCAYDEQLDVCLLDQVMREHDIDGGAIVGADWVMVDPGLIDSTVDTFRLQSSDQRLAFSQAIPGLGTMVVDRTTISKLASTIHESPSGTNHFATLGSLIGYVPIAPLFDPIAKGMCVSIDPLVRDAGIRGIADTQERVELIRESYRILEGYGDPFELGLNQSVETIQSVMSEKRRRAPSTIVLETCTGRLASGEWGLWKRGNEEPVERPVLDRENARALMHSFAQIQEDSTIVFDGIGDPLMHPHALEFVSIAKEAGISCVEMRTDLLCEGLSAADLLDSGIDILSVDVLSENEESYSSIVGIDRLDSVYTRLQELFDQSKMDRGSMFWLVPRLTRCDRVYEEIEQFYNKWLMVCGSAVIDPVPSCARDQRMKPLPVPHDRKKQFDRLTMYVRSDGSIHCGDGQEIVGVNVFEDGIELAYQRMCSSLRSTCVELKSSVSECVA